MDEDGEWEWAGASYTPSPLSSADPSRLVYLQSVPPSIDICMAIYEFVPFCTTFVYLSGFVSSESCFHRCYTSNSVALLGTIQAKFLHLVLLNCLIT